MQGAEKHTRVREVFKGYTDKQGSERQAKVVELYKEPPKPARLAALLHSEAVSTRVRIGHYFKRIFDERNAFNYLGT